MKQVNETFILLLLTDLIYLGGRRKKKPDIHHFRVHRMCVKNNGVSAATPSRGCCPFPNHAATLHSLLAPYSKN